MATSSAEATEPTRSLGGGWAEDGRGGEPRTDLRLARAYLETGENALAGRLSLEEMHRAMDDRGAAPDRSARVVDAFHLVTAAGAGAELAPRDHLVAGRGLAELGRLDRAAEVIAEGLARLSAAAQAGGGDGPLADAMLFELADVNERQGRRERAADILRLLVKLIPAGEHASAARWRLRGLP